MWNLQPKQWNGIIIHSQIVDHMRKFPTIFKGYVQVSALSIHMGPYQTRYLHVHCFITSKSLTAVSKASGWNKHLLTTRNFLCIILPRVLRMRNQQNIYFSDITMWSWNHRRKTYFMTYCKNRNLECCLKQKDYLKPRL